MKSEKNTWKTLTQDVFFTEDEVLMGYTLKSIDYNVAMTFILNNNNNNNNNIKTLIKISVQDLYLC